MRAHKLLAAAATAAAALVVAPAALAAAPATPAGLPGPPPGNGTELPAAPGAAPAGGPNGPATTFQAPSGPGLLRDASNTKFNRSKRSFTLTIACQAKGTVKVKGRGVRGTLGTGSYRCKGGTATVKVTASRAATTHIARLKKVPVTATFSEAGRKVSVGATLIAGGSRSEAATYWTDGNLACGDTTSTTPVATLKAPDFTYKDPLTIPVSIRGWVALYTAKAGWHWYGVGGENRGRWDTWTSSPTGIVQWHPNGQIQPNATLWGPLSPTLGQQTTAIGVYEIVYWSGGGPKWQWNYVNAGNTGAVANGGGNPFCVYP
jgi:hypothetical protein